MVKVKPQVYEVNGREFEDKAEAEKYEALVSAERRFKQSQDDYYQLLAETHKTADGYKFEWGVWSYYLPRWSVHGAPHIIRVSCTGRDCRMNDGRLYLIPYTGEGKDRNTDWTVEIGLLYYSDKAAKTKLLEMMQEYAKDIKQQIKKLQTEVM